MTTTREARVKAIREAQDALGDTQYREDETARRLEAAITAYLKAEGIVGEELTQTPPHEPEPCPKCGERRWTAGGCRFVTSGCPKVAHACSQPQTEKKVMPNKTVDAPGPQRSSADKPQPQETEQSPPGAQSRRERPSHETARKIGREDTARAEKAEAENKRLREALEQVDGNLMNIQLPTFTFVRKIVGAALRGEE